MNSLSNTDILKILKNYGIEINGIFSKDLLPNTLEEGWYIVNLQNHNKGNGTHWVCCCKQPLEESIYFDSFGFDSPEDLSIDLNPYEFNKREIQNIDSSACGYFCIALIKYLEANKEKSIFPILMKRFSNNFCRNTLFNDKILNGFL